MVLGCFALVHILISRCEASQVVLLLLLRKWSEVTWDRIEELKEKPDVNEISILTLPTYNLTDEQNAKVCCVYTLGFISNNNYIGKANHEILMCVDLILAARVEGFSSRYASSH